MQHAMIIWLFRKKFHSCSAIFPKNTHFSFNTIQEGGKQKCPRANSFPVTFKTVVTLV